MRPIRVRRTAGLQQALAVCGALALSACAAHYAQVPPRLDLAPYGRVALVTFRAERSDPGLTESATQRFAQALLAGQSGIELIEIGAADSALRGLPANVDGATLAQALGRSRDVPAVFVGRLTMSEVKPRGRLGAGGSLDLQAGVTAQLSVQLVSTRTGGTMWRSSANANSTLGHVGLSGGGTAVAMRDPDEAYGEVVRSLVTDVTRDLRPTWVKQ
jgi:hypothetical protein